jgi:hypothetical protein
MFLNVRLKVRIIIERIVLFFLLLCKCTLLFCSIANGGVCECAESHRRCAIMHMLLFVLEGLMLCALMFYNYGTFFVFIFIYV